MELDDCLFLQRTLNLSVPHGLFRLEVAVRFQCFPLDILDMGCIGTRDVLSGCRYIIFGFS